ncbi:MAG: hypothetical protein AAFV38_08975 [Pseudomonadota bacterium]
MNAQSLRRTIGPLLCVFMGATASHSQSFSDLIGQSRGYLSVRPGVILVEGDYATHICKVKVTDAAFDAYAEGRSPSSDDMSYVCIPIEEFED